MRMRALLLLCALLTWPCQYRRRWTTNIRDAGIEAQ